MDNGNRIGFNIYIKNQEDDKWHYVGTPEEVKVKLQPEEQTIDLYNVPTSVEGSFKIYSSKNGKYGEVSKCMYYLGSKKIRIRKKYLKKMYRLLGGI